MARRPSKHLRPTRPLAGGHASSQVKADGVWVVRSIPGARAEKTYRCPGCQQVVTPMTPHLVVWPAEPSWQTTSPVEERRHWHTGCWHRRP